MKGCLVLPLTSEIKYLWIMTRFESWYNTVHIVFYTISNTRTHLHAPPTKQVEFLLGVSVTLSAGGEEVRDKRQLQPLNCIFCINAYRQSKILV